MIWNALRASGWAAMAVIAGLAFGAGPVSASGQRVNMIDFSDLQGWDSDDHQAALRVFQASCPVISKARLDEDWSTLCALADTATDARSFFERFFRPVVVGNPSEALFTGYYEPELLASSTRTGQYNVPLYAVPPEVRSGPLPWATRAEIETGNLLEGRGLEIAWLKDPVEAFFLQVQGSGRLKLTDGSVLRVGFGGKNGHEYRSVGKELVRRGVYEPHQVSAQMIKNWVRRNPEEGRLLLHHNPSFVFFREVKNVALQDGPLGAIQVPLTEGRSLAVDPAHVPLGAPVWLEKAGANPFNRLMVAQDTGSAIKGQQRADVFFGSGDAAGRQAGRTKDGGRMVVLLPIESAFAADPGL